MASKEEASDTEENIVVEVKETECEIAADYQDGYLKEKFKTVVKSTKKIFARGGNTGSTEEDLADVRQKYWRMDSYYPFKGSPNRKYMLHIVNETFNNPDIPDREGAHVDLKNINDISRSLGFKKLNKRDKMNFTKEETLESLKETVKKLKLKNESDISCECFLFFISTHGEELMSKNKKTPEHVLHCRYGEVLPTRNVIEMFNDQNCPPLRGKPKIFIIQACRGGKKDEGVEVTVLEDNPSKSGKDIKPGTENTDAKGSSEPTPAVSNEDATGKAENVEDPHISVSCYDDMLVMYAIPPKYVAWRNARDGSWMIHYLHNVIKEYQNYQTSRPTNFLKLLTEVARQMSKRVSDPNGFKAVPVIEHRLTKHILL